MHGAAAGAQDSGRAIPGDNLLAYLAEQRAATGRLPDDRTIVVERFRDEIGDWRVVVHTPFGAPVHAPWALCIGARMRERYGTDVQAVAGDGHVRLSWTSTHTRTAPVSHYRVLRDGVAVVDSGTNGFVDRHTTNGTTYTYAVVAVGGGGESGTSNTVTATPV